MDKEKKKEKKVTVVAYKRKYRKGQMIHTMDEALRHEFLYICDKITHSGWFQSFQVRMFKHMIDCGRVYAAIPNIKEGDGSD